MTEALAFQLMTLYNFTNGEYERVLLAAILFSSVRNMYGSVAVELSDTGALHSLENSLFS